MRGFPHQFSVIFISFVLRQFCFKWMIIPFILKSCLKTSYFRSSKQNLFVY